MSQNDAYYDAFHSTIFGQSSSEILAPFLKGYSEEERKARLSIYQNNTFYSLKNALKDLYPAVEKTIGEALFGIASREYFLQSPPTNPAMIELGESFPKFLAEFSATKDLSYLPDLARFELIYHQSFHSEDAPLATAEDFSALDISTLANARLTLCPAAYLFESDYAVFDIWKLALNPDNESTSINANIRQHVLFSRPSIHVEAYLIPEDLYFFLNLLFNGSAIGTALEQAQQHNKEFSPPDAISFLIQSNITSTIVGEFS